LASLEENEEGFISTLTFDVDEHYKGERLDKVVAELAGKHYPDLTLTRSKIEKLIEDGSVTVNGKLVILKSYKIEGACTVEVQVSKISAKDLVGDREVNFEVIYDDPSIAVINKQAGLIVHPGDGNELRTLAHGLVFRYGLRGVGHPKRPGIVHRLDKDTSGLMVVALNQSALTNLREQFLPPRKVHRTYFAITRKPPKASALPSAGIISFPIGRDLKNPVKMGIREDGREAKTKYRFVEEFAEGMLVELELETGRTHQIRVHLEQAGIPIVGDALYNRGLGKFSKEVENVIKTFDRQALHAAKLAFEHPETKKPVSFDSEFPPELQKLISTLKG
jgi:23S rRNA pseudouridine1911/1915/1917 synthase